jgi:hypothetical protein
MARVLATILVALLALSACANQGDIGEIKSVIEKANHEQEDAFAAHDPTLMQDTNTAQNFAFMVRTNDELAAEGTIGVRLTSLEWGQIKVLSPTTATAETWETWEQTDQDGNTYSERERNIYQMLRIGPSWKIDQITYPDREEMPQPEDSALPTPSGKAA